MRVYHPDFASTINVEVEPLPDDNEAAVARTLRKMARYGVADSHADVIQDAVRAAVASGVEPTPLSVLADLHRWIRRNVRFVEDDVAAAGAGFGSGNEVLIRPCDLLRMPRPSEDCDGFSMLASAMILAAGEMFHVPYRVSYVVVATNDLQPEDYSHVYCYVALSGRVIPFDASHGPYLGWEVRNRFHKRAVWPVGGDMFARTLGRDGRPVRAGHYGLSRVRLGRLGQDTITTLSPDVIDTTPIVETSYPGLSTSPSSSVLPSVLGPLITGSLDIVKQVTLPQGAFVQTTPYGTTMSRGVPGAVPSPNLSLTTGGGLGTTLLIGGVALAVVLAMGSRGR